MLFFNKPYIKLIAFILILLLVYWGGMKHGTDKTNIHWENRWLQRDMEDSVKVIKTVEAQREEELRRQEVVLQQTINAEKEIAEANDNAAAADRVADKLRRQLRLLQSQFAGSETGKLSSIARNSQAKSEAIILLTKLLQESDERAGDYARQADEDHIAGQYCEIIYDRISGK